MEDSPDAARIAREVMGRLDPESTFRDVRDPRESAERIVNEMLVRRGLSYPRSPTAKLDQEVAAEKARVLLKASRVLRAPTYEVPRRELLELCRAVVSMPGDLEDSEREIDSLRDQVKHLNTEVGRGLQKIARLEKREQRRAKAAEKPS